MKLRTPLLSVIALLLAGATGLAQAPPDAEIRRILAERVGAENAGVGIVVGVIEPQGRRIVSYGSLAKDDRRPLNGDTVFEIGSMTKVFTSLLLMDMARKGELSLDDPVEKFLPASVKVPERNGKKITLRELSTQSSGLPSMPSNFAPKERTNPYADYSVEQMYQFLSGYQLTRDVGERYEYSNFGVGLLGHVLSLRAGTDYEALVLRRIAEPLGLKDTRMTLTPDMRARLAIGHNATVSPVANWDIPTLAGAGALRSTANDVLTFLAANLGYVTSPLDAAMAQQISIRRPATNPRPAANINWEIAYGWHVQNKDGNSIILHGGGTGGYETLMGFDPKSRVGVVVLTNISTPTGPYDIGFHLLDGSYPVQKIEPPRERREITISTRLLDNYTGAYQLAPNSILTVTREGDQLFLQRTGQLKFPIFAESEKQFFMRAFDAQVSFTTNAEGKVIEAVLHQNGIDRPAKRVE